MLIIKPRKVSSIRMVRTANVISRQQIKRHRAQLYIPIALPHHRKEWLQTEAVPHPLPNKEDLVSLASVVLEGFPIVEVNLALL